MRAILEDVLRAHMEKAHTELAGKKVFVKAEEFELSYSRLEGGKKSSEGGYLPSGMAIRIPEEVKRLRFFVYWNDKNRVDVDLHAAAYDLEGEFIHVGWDAHFNKSGIVHSGDITHSNAAEYIDIDMAAPLRNAEASIHLYSGKQSFGQIETCYVGMMAVKRFGEKVKLYDPKNCFFTHELRLHGKSTGKGLAICDAQGYVQRNGPDLVTEEIPGSAGRGAGRRVRGLRGGGGPDPDDREARGGESGEPGGP